MAIEERPLVTISLANYEERKPELVGQIISAAVDSGFFALTDHGITEEDITSAFAMSEKFFSLDPSVKSKYPFERTKATTFSASIDCRMLDGRVIPNYVPAQGHMT